MVGFSNDLWFKYFLIVVLFYDQFFFNNYRFNFLYSIAKNPQMKLPAPTPIEQPQRSGKSDREVARKRIRHFALEVRELLGPSVWRKFVALPLDVGNRMIDNMALADATALANLYQQFTSLKQVIWKQYGFSDRVPLPAPEVQLNVDGSFPEGSIGRQLIDVGLKNAVADMLCSGADDEVATQRIKEELIKAIAHLGMWI